MSIRINLGYNVRDYNSGLETEDIPLEYFKYNILISGKDQIEKSALLSHIFNQFQQIHFILPQKKGLNLFEKL